jgi:hypothetical protein
MLHSATGEPEHYRLTLAAAMNCHRLLLIETDTADRAQWRELLLCRPPPLPLEEVVARAASAPPPQAH